MGSEMCIRDRDHRALAVQADTTDNPILRVLDATLKQVFSLALFAVSYTHLTLPTSDLG